MSTIIQPTTLDFIKNLSENNNREWFLANKKTYEAAKANILAFATELITKSAAIDPTIGHLEAKKCVFRINRDIRFSKDKSPYKTNMGIWMSKGGKNAMTAGYYFQIQPNESFIGGGYYQPMPEDVKKIREEIDYNFEEFLGIINAKPFLDFYGKMSFEESLMLKRPPKGYDAENPAIEYLKLKSYTALKSVEDSLILAPNFMDNCLESVAALKPLIDFLNRGIVVV